MKFWMKIVLVGLFSLMLVMGCSKDDKKGAPTSPATGSAVTGSNGQATVNVGDYSVNATVRDDAQTALANINLSGYLTHNNVVIIANDPSGARYSSITSIPATSASSIGGGTSRIQSPDQIASTAVDVTFILYDIGLGVYTFQTDPAGMDDFTDDEWTTETWYNGSLTDVYNAIDTTDAYANGVFVHLTQAVATAMGSPIRTALFVPSEIDDYATFSTLFSYALQIFDGDTLHFSQMSYSGTLLPMLFVDNVIANRNFWAQFTLVWGENPSDLDSHLWTPNMGVDSLPYHICYYRRGYQEYEPFANLDVDDVTSYGPEHVTIFEPYDGIYTYAIYHFSGSGTLATSGASVSLLKPDGTVQSFNVPSDTVGVGYNYWWHVCTINGTTGEVIPINTISENPPFPDEIINSVPKPVAENSK